MPLSFFPVMGSPQWIINPELLPPISSVPTRTSTYINWQQDWMVVIWATGNDGIQLGVFPSLFIFVVSQIETRRVRWLESLL